VADSTTRRVISHIVPKLRVKGKWSLVTFWVDGRLTGTYPLGRIVGISDTWQPASNMGSTSAVSRFFYEQVTEVNIYSLFLIP
jgi:hypothetical protein